MFIMAIFGTGILSGLIPGLLGSDKIMSIPNISLGCLGALVGAFLGFGDVPLFLEFPFLNEVTLMIAGSLIAVLVKVLLTGKRKIS